jgi:hypothetical protein
MVTGSAYEEVLSETGLPEFVKCLREKGSLKERQREMNEKFNKFLLTRGFGIISTNPPAVLGRRYVANLRVLHPQTNVQSALEHNIVIDEDGKCFDPSPDGKPPYTVSALREIVFLGN